MEDIIKALEETVKNLKLEWQEQQKLNQPHRSFKAGDWVTNGRQIGALEWVREGRGYMLGVHLKNEDAYIPFEKRDEWVKVSEEVYNYYPHPHN